MYGPSRQAQKAAPNKTAYLQQKNCLQTDWNFGLSFTYIQAYNFTSLLFGAYKQKRMHFSFLITSLS